MGAPLDGHLRPAPALVVALRPVLRTLAASGRRLIGLGRASNGAATAASEQGRDCDRRPRSRRLRSGRYATAVAHRRLAADRSRGPNGRKPMQIGSGAHRYEWIDNWAQIPASAAAKGGWAHPGVAVTAGGEIVTFHPGEPALLFFAADGR